MAVWITCYSFAPTQVLDPQLRTEHRKVYTVASLRGIRFPRPKWPLDFSLLLLNIVVWTGVDFLRHKARYKWNRRKKMNPRGIFFEAKETQETRAYNTYTPKRPENCPGGISCLIMIMCSGSISVSGNRQHLPHHTHNRLLPRAAATTAQLRLSVLSVSDGLFQFN